jgi:hypothetical protein
MRSKDFRKAELSSLLSSFGVVLTNTDESIQELNDWFVREIRPLPDRTIPDRRSLSVCEDVALFLGDVMISRHRELRWDLFIWGKMNIAFQSPVIMGFPGEDPKWHGNMDVARIVHGYGAQVLEDRRGMPTAIEVPPGHMLDGVTLDPVPVNASEFTDLLEKVRVRCERGRALEAGAAISTTFGIEAQLESELPMLFDADYQDQVARARNDIEGSSPLLPD